MMVIVTFAPPRCADRKSDMSKPFIRPVRGDDFDDIFALAQEAGGGMTNLPADEPALRARIDFSVQSFAAGATEPGPEVYMLVLEQDGRVVGTSAVFSAIGLSSGFVNYKVNWMFHASEQLGKRISRRVLSAARMRRILLNGNVMRPMYPKRRGNSPLFLAHLEPDFQLLDERLHTVTGF